ncbi:FliH/SctL family protein [Tessaracoccus sp.]
MSDPNTRLSPAFPVLGLPSETTVRQSPARTRQAPVSTLEESYAGELAALREQAIAGGHLDGFTKGMAEAGTAVAQARADAVAVVNAEQAVWARQMSLAVDALAAAAGQLDQRFIPALDDLVGVVSASAFELTTALLQRELVRATDPGLDAIRRVLRLCPEDAPVRVRLHPADLARLDLVQLGELSDLVTVTGDDTVEPGGALAESGSRRIDAQMGAAMIRARKALEA